MAKESSGLESLGLTALTMVAFAGNSLLCRGALATEGMDALSFTGLRLSAGAVVLGVLLKARSEKMPREGSWSGAAALLIYAMAFSIAYRTLDAGAGALILFAAVQLTMMGASWVEGERPSGRVWVGFVLALGGLVALLWPSAGAPDPLGAGLMTLAGVGWGVYSLLGRGSSNPLGVTAGNFLRACPFAVLAWCVAVPMQQAQVPLEWTAPGVLLALGSGGVASGLGYALWYRALRGLSTSVAAIAQLSVPVIAMFGGMLLLDESVGLRAAAAAGVTLLGIAVATAKRPD